MKVEIQTQYSGKIRVRVAGLFRENDQLLLVRLRSPISGELIWIPPGGGVNFKESLQDALIREFQEETSLRIEVGQLRHIREMIEKEFHVYEFFFDVFKVGGKVELGSDPEHPEQDQLLDAIGFFSQIEIQQMNTKPEFVKKEFWNKENSTLFFGDR